MTLVQAAELIKIALDDEYVRRLSLERSEDRQTLVYWIMGALAVADWPYQKDTVDK